MKKIIYIPTPEYRKRKWTVAFEAIKGCYGDCCHHERLIRIHPDQADEEKVDTFIHEILHAVRGDEETHVSMMARASMIALRHLDLLSDEE